MKRSLFAAFLATLCTVVLWAQPQLKSPEVHSDQRVTFRLLGPHATDVELKADFLEEPLAMTKDENGVWSVTVGPLDAEIYEYTFIVDSAEVTDPRNRSVKVWRMLNSIVEVSSDGNRVWQRWEVPHGSVHHHWYKSSTVGLTRGFYVYTPPGYVPRSSRAYPVLYLLHGSGDDESAWIDVGKANWIADNMIAEGKIEPFVIIMPYGHAVPDGVRSYGEYKSNFEAFVDDLVNDLMPVAESIYPVLKTADKRAIAGLSMGGGQSVGGGLMNLDRFDWIGGFSASVSVDLAERFLSEVAKDATAANQKIRLLWIACGKDDFLFERNQEFVSWLEENGVKHEFKITEGGHQWRVWRGYLQEFLSRLWKN